MTLRMGYRRPVALTSRQCRRWSSGRPCKAELDALRGWEKAHTREGDAIAAARRRLPMVEVDPTITLIAPPRPGDVARGVRGRRQIRRQTSLGKFWFANDESRAEVPGGTAALQKKASDYGKLQADAQDTARQQGVALRPNP